VKQANLTLKIVLIFLLSCSVYLQDQQKDIENFLEYIRQILLRAKELQEKQQKKQSEEERKKRKKKIKKMILNKLANPFYYYLKRQHTIIKTEKPQVPQSGDGTNSKTSFSSSAKDGMVYKEIKSILKQNPQLFPFLSLPQNKLFKSMAAIKSTTEGEKGSVQNSSDEEVYIKEDILKNVERYYREVSAKAKSFWEMFNLYFVVNKGRFKYLRRKICPNEIDIARPGFNIFLSGYSFSPLARMEDSYYLSSYAYFKCNSFPLLAHSLCTNLSYLNSFAICKNVDGNFSSLITILNQCLKNGKYCIKVSGLFRKAISTARKYFEYAQMIFKNQMLPAIVEMCGQECLCKDLGFKTCQTAGDDSLQSPEMVVYMLSYNTIKQIEKIDDTRYAALEKIVKSITQARKQEYALKEVTKCGEVERGFNSIIQNFYNEWEKEGLSQQDIDLLKAAEREFLVYFEDNDRKNVEESYGKFIEGIAKLKRAMNKLQILLSQLQQFLVNNKDKDICLSYLVGEFFNRFNKVAQRGPEGDRYSLKVLLNIDNSSFYSILPDTYMRRYKAYLLYFSLLRQWSPTFSTELSLTPEKVGNSVADGVILLSKLWGFSIKEEGVPLAEGEVKERPEFPSWFITLLDYHIYFFNMRIKFAQCVEGKSPVELLGGDKTKASFLECLFEKKDLKICLEENYLYGRQETKKVWDEFFALTKLNALKADRVEEILAKVAETFGKKDILYSEIFQTVKSFCSNICCKGISEGDKRHFGRLCSTSPCSVANCKVCYDSNDGKIKCPGESCQGACLRVAEIANLLLGQVQGDISTFCQRAVPIVQNCPKDTQAICGDAKAAC
jgi:hypothetical protein